MVSSRSSNSLTGMQMFLGLRPHRTSDYLEFVTLKDITTKLLYVGYKTYRVVCAWRRPWRESRRRAGPGRAARRPSPSQSGAPCRPPCRRGVPGARGPTAVASWTRTPSLCRLCTEGGGVGGGAQSIRRLSRTLSPVPRHRPVCMIVCHYSTGRTRSERGHVHVSIF